MARGFADGAWLVRLASIQDPMLVPQATVSALGAHDLSAGLSVSSLAEYLAGASALPGLNSRVQLSRWTADMFEAARIAAEERL
jgi:predicted ATPase